MSSTAVLTRLSPLAQRQWAEPVRALTEQRRAEEMTERSAVAMRRAEQISAEALATAKEANLLNKMILAVLALIIAVTALFK